jgi:Bacterial RNA polymerase, alpha chain C terminal domain
MSNGDLELRLKDLGLSKRVCNALRFTARVEIVGDLVAMTELDVLKVPGIGKGSLAAIKMALADRYLKLRAPPVQPPYCVVCHTLHEKNEEHRWTAAGSHLAMIDAAMESVSMLSLAERVRMLELRLLKLEAAQEAEA